jgi:hypothetical protein
VQSVPQFIPAGSLTIVPLGVPLDVISFTIVVVNAYPEELLKVAVHATLLFRVTLPAVQLLDHPANVEPGAAVARRLTFVPLLKLFVHVLPQLIPVGLLVTVPVPVPARLTERVYVLIGLNTAVHVMLAFIVTLASLQSASPDQLAKLEPLEGAAANLTTVPPV